MIKTISRLVKITNTATIVNLANSMSVGDQVVKVNNCLIDLTSRTLIRGRRVYRLDKPVLIELKMLMNK